MPQKEPRAANSGFKRFSTSFILRINDNHVCSVYLLCLSSHLQTTCERTFATTVAATVVRKVASIAITSSLKRLEATCHKVYFT